MGAKDKGNSHDSGRYGEDNRSCISVCWVEKMLDLKPGEATEGDIGLATCPSVLALGIECQMHTGSSSLTPHLFTYGTDWGTAGMPLGRGMLLVQPGIGLLCATAFTAAPAAAVTGCSLYRCLFQQV